MAFVLTEQVNVLAVQELYSGHESTVIIVEAYIGYVGWSFFCDVS
jgi:hypothetical protein